MFYRFFRSKEILYGYPLHVFQTLKKHIKCDIALKIIADLHSDFIIGYRPNNNVEVMNIGIRQILPIVKNEFSPFL